MQNFFQLLQPLRLRLLQLADRNFGPVRNDLRNLVFSYRQDLPAAAVPGLGPLLRNFLFKLGAFLTDVYKRQSLSLPITWFR